MSAGHAGGSAGGLADEFVVGQGSISSHYLVRRGLLGGTRSTGQSRSGGPTRSTGAPRSTGVAGLGARSTGASRSTGGSLVGAGVTGCGASGRRESAIAPHRC
jgi:hypothetical protein